MEFPRKRKVDRECRAFNKDWMLKYFFTKVGKKAVCLLCGQSVAVLKEYNISHHYATKHASYGNNIIYQQWNGKLEQQNWTENLQGSRCIRKRQISPESFHSCSYRVACSIAKHSKPFSDGEFFKKCMLDVADQVCPEHRQKFEEVSLSRRTVACRIKAIGEDLASQLKGLVPSF